MSAWGVPYLWTILLDGRLDFWSDKPGIVRHAWKNRAMAESYIEWLEECNDTRKVRAVPLPNTGIF